MQPSYLQLHSDGTLCRRAEQLTALLENCHVCPRSCNINRLKNERGYCRTGRNAMLSSYCVHHGEEPPISGQYGSGTIFFTHCNLACLYCQNSDISQQSSGYEVSSDELAQKMLMLQQQGCHNINVVSPSHVIPQIVEALLIAVPKGLHIPLVYNSNGYDDHALLEMLEGIFDIFMPDLKYASSEIAYDLSDCSEYWVASRRAVREMYRQVGPLKLSAEGVAERGLLVRHLVLPDQLSGSEEVLRFIATELSTDISLSIMAQYNPCHNARERQQLNRRITAEEYDFVVEMVRDFGFEHAYCQELTSSDIYLPDFNKEHPFE